MLGLRWPIGLWTVVPFDYNLIQMDDYPADSCAISSTAFLLFHVNSHTLFNYFLQKNMDRFLLFCHLVLLYLNIAVFFKYICI